MSTHSNDGCYCSLNVHKRYDRHLPKNDVLPKYPLGIKSIYGKDYIHNQPTQLSSARTVEKKANVQPDYFAERPTPKRSSALPQNYSTSYERQFYAKKPRDTAGDAE